MNLLKHFRNWSLLVFLFALGCSSDKSADEDFLVTIETPQGDMKVILYDETPLHKANFVKLAKEGKYDGTLWHRIIEGFMIQGGDVYGNNQEPEGARIPAEIVPGFFHTKGSLAAARQGDQINPERKSSSCQFYIVHGETYDRLTTDLYQLNTKFGEMLNSDPQKYQDIITAYQEAATSGGQKGAIDYIFSQREFVAASTDSDFYQPLPGNKDAAYKKAGGGTTSLDGQYTVFGQVVEGLDVVDKIAATTTGPGDKPLEDIDMKVRVDNVSKDEITSKYGYEYKQ